ncbi:MAG: hypothetical protein FWD94_07535 [Treponema sp.]|nr:hypothetical protein [Treponema sp.]
MDKMTKNLPVINSIVITSCLALVLIIWISIDEFDSRFDVSIQSRMDSVHYLTVIFENRAIVKNFRIDPLSWSFRQVRARYEKRIREDKRVFFTFQLRESKNASPVWEEVFYFPDGGIDILSARGGLVIDMVFYREGDEIKYFMTGP